MEIPLIRGRNFSSSSPSDSGCIILNEAAAIAFGWSDPVGKKLSITAAAGSDSARPPVLSVIGVIADYHYYSLRTRIEPAVFLMEPERYSGMVIRLSQGLEKNQRDSVMKYVEHTWNEFFPQNQIGRASCRERV